MTSRTAQALRLFYCYSHVDERHRQQLENHLAPLRRTNILGDWHDRRIEPGHDWAREIGRNLEDADIVLLLVSSDFLASDYCYGVEMERALQQHEQGNTRVVPIIVRPVDFEGTPLAHLQALPRDARAVTLWPNEDAAWVDIARGIRRICNELILPATAPPQPRTPDSAAKLRAAPTTASEIGPTALSPAVEPSLASSGNATVTEETIRTAFQRLANTNLDCYNDPDIPPRALEQAKARFVPGNERVITFVNNSKQWSGGIGLAITSHGLHWHNGHQDGPHHISWNAIARMKIQASIKWVSYVTVGEDHMIDLGNSEVKPQALARALRVLQAAARSS